MTEGRVKIANKRGRKKNEEEEEEEEGDRALASEEKDSEVDAHEDDDEEEEKKKVGEESPVESAVIGTVGEEAETVVVGVGAHVTTRDVLS